MKNRFFIKLVFCIIYFIFINISCVSIKNESIENVDLLDGVWENNAFVLVIRQNFYLSYFNSVLYGMGTITYNGRHFTLTSTYARESDYIIEYIEEVNGRYKIINDDILNISGVRGRYRSFNGNWNRMKDVKPEDLLEIKNEEGLIM